MAAGKLRNSLLVTFRCTFVKRPVQWPSPLSSTSAIALITVNVLALSFGGRRRIYSTKYNISIDLLDRIADALSIDISQFSWNRRQGIAAADEGRKKAEGLM